MGKVALLFIVFAFLAIQSYAMDQDNEIDVVLNLLKDLKSNAEGEMELLDQNWQQNKSLRDASILTFSNSAQQQRGECQNRDQDVANKERDIRITLDFINWLENRMKANNARLDLLDEVRCDSNANYIQDIKNSRMVMNIIQFLRKSLQNASQADLPALLQTQEFKTHLNTFIQLNKKESTLKLLQLTSGQNFEVNELDENPEEIRAQQFITSNNNVDPNDQPTSQDTMDQENTLKMSQQDQELQTQAEQLVKFMASGASDNSQQFTQAQQQLLDLLDQMENEVQGQMSSGQDNEVKSAMAQKDFKNLVHKENQTFDHFLVQENENLKKLQNQLITALKVTAQCKARLQQITQALQLANEDFSSAEESYESQKERAQSEIDLFEEVYRIYATQVGSQSAGYKADVQSRIRL